MAVARFLPGLCWCALAAVASRGAWSELGANARLAAHAGDGADALLRGALGENYALYAALRRADPQHVWWFEERLDAASLTRFIRLRTLLYPVRVHALRDLAPDWAPPPGALGPRDRFVDHAPHAPFAARALLVEESRGDGWVVYRAPANGETR
ncbi:MAG: hypothetical protein EPO68_00620 [Planctomycetota bacterium]|nr:MAG: hypothetical protein EPO68_00620 [Planctomycetota bacterium]